MTACMGGFCAHRDQCARYHQIDRKEPAERLCERGKADMFAPVQPLLAVRADLLKKPEPVDESVH
jgi:hypothetical protein